MEHKLNSTNKMGKRDRGRLLTPSKASEIYGIKIGKFYQWVRNKKFPYIKPEKEILFWESDFLEFLNLNTVAAEPEYTR